MAITARVTTSGGLAESLGLVVGTGTTLTPNMPDGWAEDDRLFVVVVWRQGVRQTHSIPNYDAVGASSYRDFGAVGVGVAIYEADHLAAAAETAPEVTQSGGSNRGWSVHMIALRDAGAAQSGITGYTLSNDGDDFVDATASYTPSNWVAAAADGLLIQLVCAGNDVAIGLGTADQGATLLAGGADHDTGVSADHSVGSAYKVPTTSGSQTAPEFSAGSATWCGISFHVAEPAAGGPTYTDSLTTSATASATLVDAQGYVDHLTRSLAASATLTDTAHFVDSVLASLVASTSLTDLGSVSESLSVSASTSLSLADVQGYRDSLLAAASTTAALTDALHMVESLATSVSAVTTLADAQGYVDSLVASLVASAILSDTLNAVGGYTEHLETLLTASTSLSEAKSAVESLLAQAVLSGVLTDTRTLPAENLTVTAATTVTLEDAARYVDSLLTAAGVTTSLTEVMAYVESLDVGAAITTQITERGDWIESLVVDTGLLLTLLNDALTDPNAEPPAVVTFEREHSGRVVVSRGAVSNPQNSGESR